MGEKRCYGCMKLKTQTPLCEHCGYNEEIDNLPHQLPIGTVLQGRYEIGKVLGQGGFGITYIGWDRKTQTTVAVKEFYPSGLASRESATSRALRVNATSASEDFERNRRRFLQEARVLQKLNDVPQIVRVENLLVENNTAYIVMEYIRGVDLRRYIRMVGGRLSVSRTLDILCPIMEALQKAHEAGLVHRDVSPDNIMLMPDGKAKLLDFGAAREFMASDVSHVQSTEAILKHGFAPIEQYQRRGTLGPWTDVYALGATIYYCLTGRIPPDAPKRIMEGVAIPWDSIPDLTPWQIQVLTGAIEPLPKDRIRSVEQVRTGLFAGGTSGEQTWIEPIPTTDREPPEAEPKPEPKPDPKPDPDPETGSGKNWKRLLKTGAVAAAAAAAVLCVLLIPGRKKEEPVSPGASTAQVAEKPAGQYDEPVINTDVPDQVDMAVIFHGKPAETIEYTDGSRVEIYRDGDLETARAIYGTEGELLFRFLAAYNDEGSMLYQLSFDADNVCFRADTYSYDEAGKLITAATVLEDGVIYETITYSTLNGGRQNQRVVRDHKNEIVRVGTFDLDADGTATTSKWTYADGSYNETIYNSEGYAINIKRYDADGTFTGQTDMECDSSGRPVRYVYRDGRGNIESITERFYDAEGRETGSASYDKNNKLNSRSTTIYAGSEEIGSKTTYGTTTYTWMYLCNIRGETVRSYDVGPYSRSYTEYTAWGDMLRSVSYDVETGEESSTSEYYYDGDFGFLGYDYVYISSYDNSRTETSYDSDYRETGSRTYAEDGTLRSWSEPEYNDQGKQVKDTTYKADGSIESMYEYVYDDQGQMVEYISTYYYESGRKTVYVSDGNYDIKSRTEYDGSGKITGYVSYEYEYDSNGNKLKQYIYDKNGDLESWTEYFYDADGNYLDSEWHYAK